MRHSVQAFVRNESFEQNFVQYACAETNTRKKVWSGVPDPLWRGLAVLCKPTRAIGMYVLLLLRHCD